MKLPELDSQKLNSIVIDMTFGSSTDFEEVFENLLERSWLICQEEENEDIFFAVNQAMAQGLWRTHDQWVVMMNYQTPEEAHLYNALEMLQNDLEEGLNKLLNN